MTGDAELDAIIGALRDDPRRREQLRRLIGEPDLLDLHRALTQLAQAGAATERRLDALTGRMDELAVAQAATERRLDELAVAQAATERRLDELAVAQAATERRLDALTGRMDELALAQAATERRLDDLTERMEALTEQVSTLAGHVSWLRGDALERRYREKGSAYLSRVARRLRVLSPNDLDDLLEAAVEADTLTEAEARKVRLLDAVFRGVHEGTASYLAIEVSVGVGIKDVKRARERADLLARTGTPALAVVAGEWVNPEAVEAAQAMGVWQVTNGRAVAPAA